MSSQPVRAWEGNSNEWIFFVYLRTLIQLIIPLKNVLSFCQRLYWYRASAEIIEGSLYVKIVIYNRIWEWGEGLGSCCSDVIPELNTMWGGGCKLEQDRKKSLPPLSLFSCYHDGSNPSLLPHRNWNLKPFLFQSLNATKNEMWKCLA